MKARIMRLKWAGTCAICRAHLSAGQAAYYARPKIWCAAHGATRPPGTEEEPKPRYEPSPFDIDDGPGPVATGEVMRVPRASHAVVDGDVCRVTYSTPEAFIADAMQGVSAPNQTRHGSYERMTDPAFKIYDRSEVEFLGGEVPYERFETLQGKRPWHDALAEVERMRREIDIAPHMGVKRRVAWREEGGEFSPAREREGFDACSRGTEKRRAPGAKVIRIYVNGAARCSLKAPEFLFNGASLSAAVDALESSGVRCEVWILQSTHGLFMSGPPNSALRINIKASGEALNLPHLLAWTAHLGCRRVSLFSWFIAQPRRAGTALGYPQYEIAPDVLKYWEDMDGEEAFVWPLCLTKSEADTAIAALEVHANKKH